MEKEVLDKEKLEVQLHKEPKNITTLTQLAEVYIRENRLDRASKLIETAFKEYQKQPSSIGYGLAVLDILILQWKADRYLTKGSSHINVSEGHRRALKECHALATALHEMKDSDYDHRIALRLAYIKECFGSYQDALTLLSDLITAQAMDGVDLSFIIFKAAILLKHTGHSRQCIEYLEYLQDDPPLQDGITKTYIFAFLICVYETSGEKYRVFLSKAYKDLQAACSDDAIKQPKQYKKLEQLLTKATLDITNTVPSSSVSELWQVMSVLAMDRCEYVLAAEFLALACKKAPQPTNSSSSSSSSSSPAMVGNLLHYQCEVLCLLQEKEAAEKVGEQAILLNPQSAELRNVLLQINPEKWTQKMRFLSVTKTQDQAITSEELGLQQVRDSNAAAALDNPAMMIIQNATAAILGVGNGGGGGGGSRTSTAKKEKVTTAEKKSSGSDQQQQQEPATAAAAPGSSGGSGLVNKLRYTAANAFQSLHDGSGSLFQNLRTTIINNTSNSRPGSPAKPAEQQPANEQRASSADRKAKLKREKSATNQQPSSSYRSKKPELNEDAQRMLRLTLQGNENIHYYEPNLLALSNIKRNTEKDRILAAKYKKAHNLPMEEEE